MTIELDEFCQKLGCDQEQSRALLTHAQTLSREFAMPWYVRTAIGMGAWITAIVAIALGVAVLEVGLDIHPMEGTPLAILGILDFALSLFVLRNIGPGNLFLQQIAIAFAAAGVGMTSAGVALATEELWVAALATWVLLGLVTELADSDALQFLTALLAMLLTLATLIIEELPYVLDIASVTVPLGLWLLLRPPRIDLHPTAMVLVLSLPLFGLNAGGLLVTLTRLESGGWVARLVCVASALAVTLLLWRRAGNGAARQRLAALALAAVLVGLLLPPGGSATLVVLLAGYALGSRALGIIGTLLFIYFLWTFYYVLQLTLLTKSLLLMAAGVVLIALWWLTTRDSAQEAGP
jgi:uncharacterized membrane protein